MAGLAFEAAGQFLRLFQAGNRADPDLIEAAATGSDLLHRSRKILAF
jgi:hypothetical protein